MSTDARRSRFPIAPGERIYAIGDVHGCRGALEGLMHAIRLDSQSRAPALTRLVILGDVVDRGRDGAGVLRSLMSYERSLDRFHVLLGNHEQVMAKAVEGDLEALALWLSIGGGETLKSFGVSEALVREGATLRLLASAQQAVGADVVDWLLRRPLKHRSGEVVFVHAGVRPGVRLERQSPTDLLWIREPFLSDREPRDFLVVHGHTIHRDGPYWDDYRIGVDTGAYETGRLTAVGLEGDMVWSLQNPQ